jgi:hypothetical protein
MTAPGAAGLGWHLCGALDSGDAACRLVPSAASPRGGVNPWAASQQPGEPTPLDQQQQQQQQQQLQQPTFCWGWDHVLVVLPDGALLAAGGSCAGQVLEAGVGQEAMGRGEG